MAETSTLPLIGRQKIFTDVAEITAANISDILKSAYLTHLVNQVEMEYLEKYHRGVQPILNRQKQIRPEINNKTVINTAYEIVEFKSTYLFAKPMQYINKGTEAQALADLTALKDDLDLNEKDSLDTELAEWRSKVGTAYRMSLPNANSDKDDEPKFNTYVLDPRNTFIVHRNDTAQTPVIAVKFVTKDDDTKIFSCYTANNYYEITTKKPEKGNSEEFGTVKNLANPLGMLPIIEYPNNQMRMSDIEFTIGLTDAINTVQSDRVNGVAQFIQALLVVMGARIDDESYNKLVAQGGQGLIALPEGSNIKYLVENLDQASTQTLADNMRQLVFEIQGMPNRQAGASSTSDNVGAVQFRDGWWTADGRTKKSEKLFTKSERSWLKLVLRILRTKGGTTLKLAEIEIKYTTQSFGNIGQKAQAFNVLMSTQHVHPLTAWEICELHSDVEQSYKLGQEYNESTKSQQGENLDEIKQS